MHDKLGTDLLHNFEYQKKHLIKKSVTLRAKKTAKEFDSDTSHEDDE